MRTAYLSFALLGSSAFAQKLGNVLASAKGLSDIKDILHEYPAIVNTLAAANGITIFLPKDGAKGLGLLAAGVTDGKLKYIPGLVESTLTYHVVKGVFPAASVPATAFVETLLTNTNYSSVTGGQKLQVASADGKVTLNGYAKVVTADIKFDGGIIHLIDTVLTPPPSAVEVAKIAGLSSLVGALASADLVDAIEGAKDVTIFAPTNEAFAAAKATISKLKDSQIADVLKYHVVKGVGYSTALKDGQTLPTLQGGSVKVSLAKGVAINQAKVVKANVLVKQGVVHVIDAILIPQ